MVKRKNPLKIEKVRVYKIKKGNKNIFPLIVSFSFHSTLPPAASRFRKSIVRGGAGILEPLSQSDRAGPSRFAGFRIL
jgi:hypothetical protein